MARKVSLSLIHWDDRQWASGTAGIGKSELTAWWIVYVEPKALSSEFCAKNHNKKEKERMKERMNEQKKQKMRITNPKFPFLSWNNPRVLDHPSCDKVPTPWSPGHFPQVSSQLFNVFLKIQNTLSRLEPSIQDMVWAGLSGIGWFNHFIGTWRFCNCVTLLAGFLFSFVFF